jgi:CRISPR-associated protein Csb2
LLRAVRRALMARARDENGNVSRLFSGHEPNGEPARSGRHEHVFLACEDQDRDGLIDRIMVVAPWRADRSTLAAQDLAQHFANVAGGLTLVRAGAVGLIALAPPEAPAPDDPVFSSSRTWVTRVPYAPNRHPRGSDPRAAIVRDLLGACARRRLPPPTIEIIRLTEGARGGIRACARLRFAVAVEGPIMLGRDCHAGGGLFIAE